MPGRLNFHFIALFRRLQRAFPPVWPRLLAVAACLVLLIAAYCYLARESFAYEWQWNRAWRQFGRFTAQGFKAGPLLEGVLMTIAIAGAGLGLSSVWGLFLAVARLSPWPVCARLALYYISLFRNTPLLLQLFFVYFLVAPLFGLGPLASAILTLSAFEAAYAAELFRAALLSVPRSQWEGALSLGFNLSQCLFYVILPQAFRNVLPAFAGQAVAIVKDTSLVSAIAVADLTMRAQAIVAETFLAFEVWLLVALVYLILALCLSLPALLLERRQAWR